MSNDRSGLGDLRQDLAALTRELRLQLQRRGGQLGYRTLRERPALPPADAPRTVVPFPPPQTLVPSPKIPDAGRQGNPTLENGLTPDPALSEEENLARLREHIGDCLRCPLGATRIKLAFGVGNPRARVMVIGEGPGYMEDRAGEPFVGPAGQLLDKVLAAIGLSRQAAAPAWKQVYIANMVKCHPMIDPSDRDRRGNDRPPSPEEMGVCSPFLMAQIRIIRPRFILALGATAARALLKTSQGITALRGRWFDFHPGGNDGFSVRLLPTYHPAALLRNPDLKKEVWGDVKSLKAELEKSS